MSDVDGWRRVLRAVTARPGRSQVAAAVLCGIVAFALVTTGAAALWALLVAADMSSLSEAETAERRDIRTW